MELARNILVSISMNLPIFFVVLMSLLVTLDIFQCSTVSIVNFEHANADWVKNVTSPPTQMKNAFTLIAKDIFWQKYHFMSRGNL